MENLKKEDLQIKMKESEMTFKDYLNSSNRQPIGILTTWQRNTDLTKLKVEKDLIKFFSVGRGCQETLVLIVHTKKDGLIAPHTEHQYFEDAGNIEISWGRINQVYEDGSLCCLKAEGPFCIDDGFKKVFADVFDFLTWDEFLDVDGNISELALKLIKNRV
ncbi:hypothetical protein [Fibrobacter sp. UWH3]|nr:hypothetical protein [Fibrobacter sp. UWH3]OWV00516.1 hypothetical protein B7993_16080 [Fibrobacter sp. UWH3]